MGGFRTKVFSYRQIFPPCLPALPALWPELVGIGPPNVLASMHDVHRVVAHGASGHKDGRAAIDATSIRQSRVLVSVPRVDRYHRV